MAHGRRRGLRSLSLAVVVYREDAQTRLEPRRRGRLDPDLASCRRHVPYGASGVRGKLDRGAAARRLQRCRAVQPGVQRA
jgi:hypothetical protein